MSLMSLVRGAQKSPIFVVLALTLLAVSLWVVWAVRQGSTRTHRMDRSPSAVIDDADDTNLREVWVI
jgi:hypothetical protein